MRDEGEDAEPIRVAGILTEDLHNGKYLVTYIAKYEGRYTVNVDFLGTFGGKAGPLRGSGLEISFSKTAPRENNLMSGDLVIKNLREDIKYLHEFTDNMSKNVLVRVRDDSWSSEEQIQVPYYCYLCYHFLSFLHTTSLIFLLLTLTFLFCPIFY